MRVLSDLRRLLRGAAFRRLLGVRLLAQGADGVFQVILTAYLFFSPERQTTPAAIATVAAATLLPFSLVGPFAGVLLDRWSRRNVLVGAPLVRVLLVAAIGWLVLGADDLPAAGNAVLFVLVVGGFAVNRFLLSALSAALPHTVSDEDLLSANSVVPTAGTMAFAVGLGLGGVWQGVLGGPDEAVGATLALATALWLLSALLAARFARTALGPDHDNNDHWGRPANLDGPVRGLVQGLRHLRSRPQAAAALVLVGAQRMVGGLVLVAAILLYRSTFADPDDPTGALAGLGLTLVAAGIAITLSALVIPTVVAHSSMRAAMVAALLFAAVVVSAFAAVGTEALLVVSAFALNFSGHALKICADTLVQHQVSDDHRGRVFSVYDLVFNAGLVSAAVLGAVALPVDGDSPPTMATAAVALVVLAVIAARVLPGRPVAAPTS